jgi:sugar lactone lactonase YvrE
MKRFLGRTILIALASGMLGCSAVSTNPIPPGPAHTLYVTNFAGAGQLATFALPLSGGSTPTNVFTPAGMHSVTALTFDNAGNLWAVNDTTTSAAATGYTLPITAASTPFASINIPSPKNPIGIAFDASGNLWVSDAGANAVYEFVGPFSGTMTPIPAVKITSVLAPSGMAFDGAGNLYVCKAIFGSGAVEIFNKPFVTGQSPTASPLTGSSQPTGIAFDAAGNLYAVNVNDGGIDRFNAPTAGGGPISTHAGGTATVITTGVMLAFDSTGNLYATNLQNPLLYLFPNAAATFSSTPVPTIVTVGAFGVGSTAGLAIK